VSPAPAVAWMGRRWRWYVALVFVALLAGCCYFVRGALNAGDERRASRARIEASANEAKDLAQQVHDQNVVILRIATAIDAATSQEARDRQAATLADAIAQLQKSIDCVGLHAEGESPPPCATADSHLDALRAGVDPFTRPPPSTPPPSGGTP
jgi:hypothetical protein